MRRLIKVLRQHGFHEGRMISRSKTGYCRRNRNHFVIFNAQVFANRGRILKQVDLDLTLDGKKLTEVARAVGEDLFVLYEMDPPRYWKPGDKPIAATLRESVWWTRTRRRNQDFFLPFAAGPISRKQRPLRCIVGHWQGRPAFSVDLSSNPEWQSRRNYNGAAVLLIGHPPEAFLQTKRREIFSGEVWKKLGRPVRPVFYQRTAGLAYVWFSHGAAIPALLYDLTVRPRKGLFFSLHHGNSAIHIRQAGAVVGLVWPCRISAPEVLASARRQLHLSRH